MIAARREFCALGGLFLVLAGCKTLDSFHGLLLSDSQAGDRVIAASLDSVSQSLVASLTELGMSASVTRKGDTVSIASKTSAGARFTFVLTREKTRDVEQTRVHIDWESGRDDQMGFQLLSQLEQRLSR